MVRAGLPRKKSAKDLGWVRSKGTTVLSALPEEMFPEQMDVSGQEGASDVL